MVDYSDHAAYGSFVTSAPLATRLEALSIFFKGLTLILIKRTINYELIPFNVRSDSSIAGRAKFVLAALRNTFKGLGHRAGKKAAADSKTLHRNGCLVVTMPSDRIEAIEAAATSDFAGLEARRLRTSNGKRDFEDSRWQADQDQQRDLFALLDQTLREAGIMEAAADYVGRPVKLVDVNPQINDRSDRFWKDIFPDTEAAALPPTAYFHRDASGGDLKAIFYLTDVGEKNGPFSYVLGSNRIGISKFDDLICEANDSTALAGTTPWARERFAALPKKFRQKGAFGNDLTDNSDLSREICAASWSIKAPKGSIVLFDTKGIHRGGMVEEGERRVITCVIG
jgi:hypothetical protein